MRSPRRLAEAGDVTGAGTREGEGFGDVVLGAGTHSEAFLGTTVSRMRQFLDHLDGLAAAGSPWEVDQARRGVLHALADNTTWIEAHADELVGS